MKIRKALESDLDRVEALYNELCDHLEARVNYPGWKKGVYPTRADAERGLRDGGLYVALAEGKIAGSFILRHEPEEGYKNGNWLTENNYSRIYVLYTLAVRPGYMKRGVGARMLNFAAETARREGCISLRLDVADGNIPAKRLYEKLGFRFTGTVSLGYEAYGLPWFDLYEKILE